jgi:hypothetical protein
LKRVQVDWVPSLQVDHAVQLPASNDHVEHLVHVIAESSPAAYRQFIAVAEHEAVRRVSAVDRPLLAQIIGILDIDGIAEPADIRSRVGVVLRVGVMPDEIQTVGVALLKPQQKRIVFAAATSWPVLCVYAAELRIWPQEVAS